MLWSFVLKDLEAEVRTDEQAGTAARAAREHLQVGPRGDEDVIAGNTSGNIAYWTSAEIPIREDLQTLMAPDGGIPPNLIRDGTGALMHEWMAVTNPQPNQALPFEILPKGEMPVAINQAPGRSWWMAIKI